jgi:hypothetical protein
MKKMADKAIEKGRTERYLPEKAWARLTPEERRETDEKKQRASREGANSSYPTPRKQRRCAELLTWLASGNRIEVSRSETVSFDTF